MVSLLHPSTPTHPTPTHPKQSLLDGGSRLELVHKTQLEAIPGALAPFKGRLLAGVGPALRLYELGRRKLLRKCEYRGLPHHVVQLHSMGSRVYAADVQVGGGFGGLGRGLWCVSAGSYRAALRKRPQPLPPPTIPA